MCQHAPTKKNEEVKMTNPLSFGLRDGTTCKDPALRWILSLAIFFVLFLTAVHPFLSTFALSSPALTLISVSPIQAYNDQTTTLTIRGTDFVPTPTVSLSNFPLSNVIFLNSSILTAQIPADLPEGVYSVVVTNSDSQSASLPNAFRVLASGDGSLSNWQEVTVMTTPRDWLAAVQAKNYFYILGGNNGNWGSWLTSVERATINTDGSLGSWQTMSPMNDARGVFAAVEANGYLYALGGYDILSTVERSFINPDGSLSAWQVTNSMNIERPALAAVSAYGYIYAIGGENTTTVERAKINSDGSLDPWEFTTSMNTPRGYLAAVVVGNYIYAIGGQGGGAASLRSVERTIINADGTLSPWEFVTEMINQRCDVAAVELGGYIYTLGGSNCTMGMIVYSSVERATVNADGTLSTWQILPSSLNISRYRHAAAVRSPYIYTIGGENEVYSALNSVEMAKIDKTVKIHLPFIIK